MSIYYEEDIADIEKEHTILIYCENVPGVTSNISNLFSRLGVNITSLIGASSEDNDIYRVIIKCITNPNNLEKIVKQLNKLINIISVKDSLSIKFIEYEMSLIRIPFYNDTSNELFKIIDHFQGKIVNLSHDKITLSFSDKPDRLQTIINLLKNFGEIEVVNSGVAVLENGVYNYNNSYKL